MCLALRLGPEKTFVPQTLTNNGPINVTNGINLSRPTSDNNPTRVARQEPQFGKISMVYMAHLLPHNMWFQAQTSKEKSSYGPLSF